jgi:hypothetical protein
VHPEEPVERRPRVGRADTFLQITNHAEIKLMTTFAMGSRQRHTLSSQLDRLDGILDGLSEALTEAVADAVRSAVGQAVREAVHAAVTEVLTNPELQRRLQRPASSADTTREPTTSVSMQDAHRLASALIALAGRGATAARSALGACRRFGKRIWSFLGARLTGIGRACRKVYRFCWYVPAVRRALPCALMAGLVAGVGSFVAGPVYSAVACGVAGSCLVFLGLLTPLLIDTLREV